MQGSQGMRREPHEPWHANEGLAERRRTAYGLRCAPVLHARRLPWRGRCKCRADDRLQAHVCIAGRRTMRCMIHEMSATSSSSSMRPFISESSSITRSGVKRARVGRVASRRQRPLASARGVSAAAAGVGAGVGGARVATPTGVGAYVVASAAGVGAGVVVESTVHILV